MPSPLFLSTSSEIPEVVTISFKGEPNENLGAQLESHDKGQVHDMFRPSYASISKLLDGETVAKKSNIQLGDFIVAINHLGYRRFTPDKGTTLRSSDEISDELNDSFDLETQNIGRVISGQPEGEAYKQMKKAIKDLRTSSHPFVLTLERCSWDSRAHSWPRFLKIKENVVPEAMRMLQEHEFWRDANFPIDLTDLKLQSFLKAFAISELHLNKEVPVLWFNMTVLQSLECCKNETVLKDAFIMFTESMLAKLVGNPSTAQISHFIDMTGVNIRQNVAMISSFLKIIYNIYETNYPGTLAKLVVYPVESHHVRSMNHAIHNVVSKHTLERLVVTNKIDFVSNELNWPERDVKANGLLGYLYKHQYIDPKFVFSI